VVNGKASVSTCTSRMPMTTSMAVKRDQQVIPFEPWLNILYPSQNNH
jgi:hypothetical protein